VQSELPKSQGFIGGFWNQLLWNNLTRFGFAGIFGFHRSHKGTGQENFFEIQVKKLTRFGLLKFRIDSNLWNPADFVLSWRPKLLRTPSARCQLNFQCISSFSHCSRVFQGFDLLDLGWIRFDTGKLWN
jgi:hypothetical protein